MPIKKISRNTFEEQFTSAMNNLLSITIKLMDDYNASDGGKQLEESIKHVSNSIKMHDAVREFYHKIQEEEKENSLIHDKIQNDDLALDLATELLSKISGKKNEQLSNKTSQN